MGELREDLVPLVAALVAKLREIEDHEAREEQAREACWTLLVDLGVAGDGSGCRLCEY